MAPRLRLLLAGALAAGCAGSDPRPDQGGWSATSIAGEPVSGEVWVAFRDGGLVGSGGCNGFNADYRLREGRFDVGPVAATKRLCPEPLMREERRFFALLGSASSLERDGAVLRLSGPEGFIEFIERAE